MLVRWLAVSCVLLLGIPIPSWAQDAKPAMAEQSAAPAPSGMKGDGILALLPADSVTDHVLKTPTGALPYTATAGTLALYGQDGKQSAAIFYTAYVAKERSAGRPLTFVFNGGPGAASAFVHLGLVGPRILDFGPGADDGAAAKLVDNPHSWLDFTDLVLIDPVGTGWSRAAQEKDAAHYYGVRQDAQSLAKAIALYIAHNDRADSPKYLLGESYGGFRAAKVASALREGQGILVSGIVMLSPLIDGELLFGDTFALGAALQLPSLAAAELERTNRFSPEAVKAAEEFAMKDYLVTLAGAPPTGSEAKAFYGRVAELTGIPEEVVARNNGFLEHAYVKHSATDPADVVSPYDASFQSRDSYPESDVDSGEDAVLDGFTRAYGGAFSSYARSELGFRTEMTYQLLDREVNRKWEWGNGRGGGSQLQADATDDIRALLAVAPSFRLLIAQGYSDMVTPYGLSRYVLDHLPVSLTRGRAELKVYRGGHMFYTRPDSRVAFSEDARNFFAAGARPAQAD